MSTGHAENEAIKNFVEYLKIRSVQPDVDYDECVRFLSRQAASLGLEIKVHELVPRKPVIVMSWQGVDAMAPAILLNSHMDVVPVFEESWSHPPFGGHITEDGKIFGRGSQDMKCVGIQYLEAVRRLKEAGESLKRNVHITFVPDEEIGGHDGMELFVKTEHFAALNVGFALDEGIANPEDEFLVFNGERGLWHIHVKCRGNPGHGSLLLPNTAGEKIRTIINKFMDFREEQKTMLEADPNLTIGDVTTVNLNQLYGGVLSNVIPEVLTAVFDIRLAVTVDHVQFEDMIKDWCEQAGDDVTYEFEQKNPKVECTRVDDTNPYWVLLKKVFEKMGYGLRVRTFPGATDARYVRRAGVPALGFSPMRGTPVLLHDHDEYVHADVFMEGINVYTELIKELANL